MVSRRKFFSDCSRAAVILALPSLGLPVVKAAAAPLQGPLNYAAFAAQLHSVFQVRLDSGKVVALELVRAHLAPPVRVAPGRRPPPDAQNERFSLVFTGPQEAPLPSAIHAVEHPRLGRLTMHLGEIGLREGAHLRYEAVFNQPTPARV